MSWVFVCGKATSAGLPDGRRGQIQQRATPAWGLGLAVPGLDCQPLFLVKYSNES